MKIYSTITSERAAKSQGGNKYLNVNVAVGDETASTTILEATIEREEKKIKDVYRLYLSGIQTDKIEVSKGKKQ